MYDIFYIMQENSKSPIKRNRFVILGFFIVMFLALLVAGLNQIHTVSLGNHSLSAYSSNSYLQIARNIGVTVIGILVISVIVRLLAKFATSISHSLLRLLLLFILNVLFGLICLPFLIKADGKPIEEMINIGGINMWRIVFIYGLLTLITIFFTFWKKLFRSTAVMLAICWACGTALVVTLNYLNSSSKLTTSTNKIVSSNSAICNEQEEIIQAKNCTVLVTRDDGGHGSGFSIAPGYLVTNKHVIEGAKKLSTWIDGKKELVLWNYSPTMDIAILKLPVNIQTCNWFDSSKLQVAETLYAVGWPVEATGDSTITKGIYSRLNTFDAGLEFVQTDAAINPGNSGGPLVSKCGVVGINTLKESWSSETLPRPLEGLGNALSSKTIKPLIDSLIAQGSNDTKIPKAAKVAQTRGPSQPSNSPVLDLGMIRSYLARVYSVRDSWQKARDVPQDDLNRLLDSLTRQIVFCETLSDRLSGGKKATQDDLIMWDAVVKMSYESGALTQKLNGR